MPDPIEIAAKLTQQFRTLSADYAASGFRDRRLEFLQGNFRLGVLLKENHEAYRRFKEDDYWRDAPRKPNERNVMRSVLIHTTRAKGPGHGALQNRIYKHARVLEYLYLDGVVADAIPQRLKDGGRTDGIYLALCRGTKHLEKRGDTSEEVMAELRPSRTANGTGAVQGPLSEGEVDRDRDDGGMADQRPGRSVPLSTAANDARDPLRDEVQTTGASKRAQPPRGFRKVILEVEVYEFELDQVLEAKRATICVNVAPPGNRGWRPVVAQYVFTSDRTDGPWPGRSTNNRDDDERR